MDIAQLIDVADSGRTVRAQGASAAEEGGDGFAFARSYDGTSGSDVPSDNAELDPRAELAISDPSAIGLISALQNTLDAMRQPPDIRADPRPAAATGEGIGYRLAEVRAEPVASVRQADTQMPLICDAIDALCRLAGVPDPGAENRLAAGSEAHTEPRGVGPVGGAPHIAGAQFGETPPTHALGATETPPEAIEATAKSQESEPATAVTATAATKAVAASADTVALPASPEAVTARAESSVRRAADEDPGNEQTAPLEGREMSPEAEDRPFVSAGQHGAADAGTDSGYGDRGTGEWAATVATIKGLEGPTLMRPADIDAPGRDLPLIGHEIGRQLSEAMTGMPDRPVEIALSPEELGRIRMVIATTDGTVSLQITAERPETVELMRRHADLLAQDLRQLGFDQLDFRFSGQSDGRAGNGPAGQLDRGASLAAEREVDASPSPAVLTEGSLRPAAASGRSLDIRL